MTNKKATSAVKQSLFILQETSNTFDLLQGIENDSFEEVSSLWKETLEKELVKVVTKNDEENILEEEEPQN